MTVQEVILNLLDAVTNWFVEKFGMDSGIMDAVEDVIKMIVSAYVDA